LPPARRRGPARRGPAHGGRIVNVKPPARRLLRALTGVAWALVWMSAWGLALLGFAQRVQAAPLALAVSDRPVPLPIYVAESRGFFHDEAVEVALRPCRSGRECAQALFDDRADVATCAELLVALNAAARPDLTIIGTISASSYQIK